MSGSHHPLDGLHNPIASPAHELASHVKLIALLGFVLATVATPISAVWAFVPYALVIGLAARAARLPLATLARRLTIELPFIAFALVLPFVGSDPRHVVLGVSVSIPGSWAAGAIVIKATLGTAASVILAWSTPVASVLAGLDRLRVPRIVTVIAGFMVRYLDVVTGELRRLQIARTSRADDPRWLWQGRAVAATTGTLFVRSFERGERVQQAMIARGFDGHFPDGTNVEGRAQWWPAMALPGIAVIIAVAAIISAR